MLDCRLSDPVFLRNLIIFPIKKNDGSSHRQDKIEEFSPLTIDEIIDLEKGKFHECDTPDINEIVIDNKSDFPVLMLDGEEITGSLQNRIIAQSNLVEAKTSKDIPVICVEEGRWDGIGGFQTGYCSYPRIRTILAKSRYKKMDTQQTIWNEINRKLIVTSTKSATSSMHDIYDNLQEEVSRYIENFKSLNHNTIGFIGTAGSRILSCDIFQNSNIYRKFENKLIRSYALDAIEYQRERGSHPNVEKFLKAILDTLRKKRVRKRETNIKIKGDGFLGQALIYQDNIIHLSAFPS